jgi:hypothetical protein
MKKEYDFSKGERGKFYRKNSTLNIPIYLEPKIREYLEKIATKNGQDINIIVNDLLKQNLKIARVFQ